MHRKVRRILADDGWLDPEDNAVAREVLKVEPGFGKHLLNQPPGLECLSECLASPLHRLYQCFASRSEEHTSELQSLMRISYAVFCLKKKKYTHSNSNRNNN